MIKSGNIKNKHRLFFLCIFFVFGFLNCKETHLARHTTVSLIYDSTSLIRNPAMGWGLYDDANGEVQNADLYWKEQDEAARKYASFFYIRWRWSDMEPEEGKYAWLYNDNYKKLIKGALDRGLKLCFRVYENGQDNLRPGTPGFVQQAGAKGYLVKAGTSAHWTPYPDDPVFQNKWSKFVKAFAKEYDNPDIVDFVDAFSIGAWGEAHSIRFGNTGSLNEVFDWYTSLYTNSFRRVLLLLPFNGQVGFEYEKNAIEKKGYNVRRDGLGSMWFTDYEKNIAKQMYGKVLLVGESCYWGCSSDDCRPFDKDKWHRFKSWNDVYELTCQDAIQYRFNTLDLREVPETRGWVERAPHLVKAFMQKGGYRLYPISVSLPNIATPKEKIEIAHEWVNKGNGYLPNNNIKWNYKYKPAIAILNDTGEIVAHWIDDKAEPSEWLNTNQAYKYTLPARVPQLPKGRYRWAIAIIDKTKNNTPGIQLALENNVLLNGWSVIADLTIN